MRGYVLSRASVLEALRPYVITHWNGVKEDEMPPAIREICSKAPREPRGPIRFFVHDVSGRLLKVLSPLKDTRIEGMHEHLLAELKKLTFDGVKLPKEALHLPDVSSGVRIYLKFKPRNRPIMNYRVPTVEAVSANDEERRALEYPSKSTSVDASKLRRWLEKIYPPSIMDKTGKVTRVSGTLTLAPAGKRNAVLKGEVEMTLDDARQTRYRGTVEIALAYGEGAAYTSFRGVYQGMYPKADKMHNEAIEFDMVAAIESRPE